ncbi:TlpA family protein disulfide reductase [Agrococcus lahaulensis]|uniref:TlpA family protein disulfide reductase n=1 Tax=Agrococcus lahaulensis TaxID=341722 RepID=UPI000A03435E|nr:TlpA disulfide reductase family protein [Agrococcus lahaulensis]
MRSHSRSVAEKSAETESAHSRSRASTRHWERRGSRRSKSCRAEAPVLADLHAEYGDRVDFIGINVRDGAAQALAFEEEFGIEYPSVLDDQSAQGQLAFAGIVAPNAVPSTLILDAEGRVAARVSGAVTDTSILATLLQEELER